MGFVEPASSPTPAPDETAPAESPVSPSAPAGPGTAGNAGGTAGNAAPSPRLAAREGRRPRDMVLSLAVLLIPIALLMAFYKLVLDGDKPITVDPAPAIASATREFPVAQPAGLGEDWHVSSATFRKEAGGSTLRIGYVDPRDKPVLLIQSDVAAATLVPAEVGTEGERTGAYRTDRRTWLRYDGKPGETALIVTEQDRTLVIIGDSADTANLEKLASALP